MNRFYQKPVTANETRESKVRQSFLSTSAKKHQATAGVFILVVIILHFVSQFILFPGEKIQSEITSVTTKAEEGVKSQPAYKPKNSDIEETPLSVSPVVRSKPKIAVLPPRAIIKKKETARESRAERLRRAEKILTGV